MSRMRVHHVCIGGMGIVGGGGGLLQSVCARVRSRVRRLVVQFTASELLPDPTPRCVVFGWYG